MTKACILTIGLASLSLAQLRVPVAGYVTDASSQVRPLIGAPGAALMGEPVALPQGASSVRISPDQQFAIVSGKELAVLPSGPDGLGASITVPGAMSSPDLIEFSAEGSAAALYSAKSHQIQIVTGLPAAPQVTRELSVTDDVAALAISADAGTLLAAASNGNVLLLAADGSTRLVASGNSIVALRFLADASRAAAIDQARNQILLLSGLPDAPAVQVLQNEQGGVNSPSAVQVTADGRRALIANTGNNNILNVDLTTGDVSATPCAFPPAFLQPLPRGTFLVTDTERKLVWIFDPVAARVSYVPALVP